MASKLTIEMIKPIKSHYSSILMAIRGVNSVGIGFKITNGKPIEPHQLCISVGVEKKIRRTKLNIDEVVPIRLALNGISVETDVIEIGKIVAL